MLQTVYLKIGLLATALIGILLMLTAFTWFLAMAGVVTRPMTRWHRAVWLAALTVFPPVSVAFMSRAIVRQRRELKGLASS